MLNLLASPKSRSPLKIENNKAINEYDESEYFDIKNGVVIFDPSAAENEGQKSSLSALIERARTTDCIGAIKELSSARDYLLDVERQKYIDLINFKPTDTVLEIGASMGQHSRIISQRCGHLEALEVVYEQAVFAKLWCEQDGQSSVNVSVGGADGFLPYKDNSFDVLIMNYVLEWSASRSRLNPVDYHLQFLSECFRVLRPGGEFFISTKNRHGLGLLLGAVDEHVGFRFGNALPRWLGAILGRLINTGDRLVKSGDLRGYLHSRKAIENIYQKVGFTDLKAFLLLPDARRPKVVEDFVPAGLNRIRAQGYWAHSSKKERLFSKLPFFVQRNIAQSHVYILKKPLLP